MSTNARPTVAVKLFTDKEKQRVLFAESDKEFVDVIFSFLTLPLGAIVRLLGNQSGVGCLDEVHKSVESLGTEHFQTEACKTMLLRPLNAAASHFDRLKVKLDYTNPRSIYATLLAVYSVQSPTFFAKLAKASSISFWNCLRMVVPASTCLVFSLLDKFGLDEKADIEEKIIDLNNKKVSLSTARSATNRSLTSNEPLTGMYFDTLVTPGTVTLDELPKQESKDAHTFNIIKIKFIQTADNSTVLYAEVEQDFVDLLFGLVSVPLGSIIKAYCHWPPNGCVDNLYQSVDGSASGCIRDGCKSLLLSPKLATFFGCSINALEVKELDPQGPLLLKTCSRCPKLYWGYNRTCTCSASSNSFYCYEVNPKSTSGAHDTSRAYIKGGTRNFIVTNDLRVLHFSLANSLQILRASNIPKEKLVEKELVLKLLRAAIATREALSSVLLPHKKKRHPHH
ncbi:LOW QUALITY PROTEIN: hypothetical protein U9M48_033657 [Paspalum notatum var. saurae]|uniref:Uncharacterized protein n=1 Tax=Paspalum notatum var. saurae TaxID=547442 RepID=A0AAQ3X6F5_PASNO